MRYAAALAFVTLCACGGGSGSGGSGSPVDVAPPGVAFLSQPSDGDLLDVVTDSASIRVCFTNLLGSTAYQGEVSIGVDREETARNLERFLNGVAVLGVEGAFKGNVDWTYGPFMAQLGVTATASGGGVHVEGAGLSLFEAEDSGGTWEVR